MNGDLHFPQFWKLFEILLLPSPKNENLSRSWHFEFELVWSASPHPPENENLGGSWHFKFEFIWSNPPPSQ